MISKADLEKVRHHAQHLRALVIGDVMLDKYIHGTVERISPEAPVPIVRLQHTETKCGGAANVAINLASWGCRTAIVGLVGKDNEAHQLASLLGEQEITHYWIEDESRPTTIKTRVVAASHHLLRIDQESSAYITGDTERKAVDRIRQYLFEFKPGLIVIEDYNKGLLTETIINLIKEYGRSNNVFLAVDPKEKMFFSYAGVQLFKPNMREASHASGKLLDASELSVVSQSWRNEHAIENLAITLGPKGIYIQNGHGEANVRPDRSIDVIDVCGAGDAVVVSLALGLMAGLSLEKCGALANLSGAYVCSHSGVVAVNVEEIYQWI